jgi:hypothetical protein
MIGIFSREKQDGQFVIRKLIPARVHNRSGIGWLIVAATSGPSDLKGCVHVQKSQPTGFADEERNRAGLTQLFGERGHGLEGVEGRGGDEGRKSKVEGRPRLAVGGWRLAVGGWRLAVCGLRSAVGGWRWEGKT